MTHSYYVLMRECGRHGLEAIVHPEETRRGVIERARGYPRDEIAFVNFVHDGCVEDVTEEIMEAVERQQMLEEV